jgi:hypothetical protein
MFAKTTLTTILSYPYTFADLREENPHSRYDGRFTLPEWYAQTEDAASTGAAVVEVVIAGQPEYDSTTDYLIQKTTPELIDGVWAIGWDIVERPPVVETAANAGGV